MTKVTPTLLNDTLNLVQLAREMAIAQGKQNQAQRLSPVVSEMRNLASTSMASRTQAAVVKPDPAAVQRASAGSSQPASPNQAAAARPLTAPSSNPVTQAPADILRQDDFRALLAAAKGKSPQPSSNNPQTTARNLTAQPLPAAKSTPSSSDRQQMARAMAAGNMNEVDIARQLGMSRDEVRLIVNLGQKSKTGEGSKPTGAQGVTP